MALGASPVMCLNPCSDGGPFLGSGLEVLKTRWEGDPRVWQEQMRQGSRHGVPRTGGAGPPPGGEHGHCPQRPLNWGGVHAGHRGGVPINTKHGGWEAPQEQDLYRPAPQVRIRPALDPRERPHPALASELPPGSIPGPLPGTWGLLPNPRPRLSSPCPPVAG